MRISTTLRAVVAAAVLGIGLLSIPATPAYAAGGEAKLTETKECLEKALSEATGADKLETLVAATNDCVNKAPNPIVPETSELIWGGVAFLIVLLVLMKFAFPGLKKGMKNREDKIRNDLESAEAAKADAERLRGEYDAKLASARNDAARIVEEARQSAEVLRKDLIAKAETEADELKARAAADAKAQSSRAMAELQGQVAELSIDLAEKIVERNLDRDTQRALVESYIAQVGRN